MTKEGDLVLVNMDNKPAFFARIEEISPDVKPHWFQVKLLVLQIPLMVITWILREPYINGEEFTMSGRPIRLTRVEAPKAAVEPQQEGEPAVPTAGSSERPKSGGESGAKVLSLADRLKKK